MELWIIIILATLGIIIGLLVLRAANRPVIDSEALATKPSYLVKFGFTANYNVPDKSPVKWWCSVLFTWKQENQWSTPQPIVVIEGRSPHCPNHFTREQVNEYTRRVLMQLQPEVLTLATLWENGQNALPSNIDGKVVERVGS